MAAEIFTSRDISVRKLISYGYKYLRDTIELRWG